MNQDQQERVLTTEYREVRTRLNVIAAGTTTAWGSLGGGKPGTKAPTTGEPDGDLDRLDERWELARHNADRREVIGDARFLLRCWNGDIARERQAELGRPWEDQESRDERMLREGRGWEPKLVAVAFKCSERDVVKARLAAGLEPADGQPAADVDRVTRARLLRAAGLSDRAIGREVGTSHVTVGKWLRVEKKAA